MKNHVLKQFVSDRLEAKEIARILKRTEYSVTMAKARFWLFQSCPVFTRQPFTPCRNYQIQDGGWSLEQIAEVYGCCQSNISHFLSKNEFRYFARAKRKSATSQKWSEFDEALLRRLLKRRLSLERIRTHFPNRNASRGTHEKPEDDTPLDNT